MPTFDGTGNARVWLKLFEEAASLRKREANPFWRHEFDWAKRAISYFKGAAEVWAGTVTGLLGPSSAVQAKIDKKEQDFADAHPDPPKLITDKSELGRWRADRTALDAELLSLAPDVWKAFRGAFEARFSPGRTMGELTPMLVESRRGPQEGDRGFSERLRRMVQDVPAAEVEWNTIARIFMRQQSEAIKIHFLDRIAKCKSEAEFQALVDDLLALQRMQGPPGDEGAGGRAVRGRGCYICGEMGHRMAECPKAMRGGITRAGGDGGPPIGVGGQWAGRNPSGSVAGRGWAAGPASGAGSSVPGGPRPPPSVGRGIAAVGPDSAVGTAGRGAPVFRGRGRGIAVGSAAGRDGVKCFRCGKSGHTAVRCRASVDECDAYRAANAVAAVEETPQEERGAADGPRGGSEPASQ